MKVHVEDAKAYGVDLLMAQGVPLDIAVNKARVLAANGEQAPSGSLIDAQGNPTTDPNVLFTDLAGALLPFGGHKGYAMGLVAELLTGVLSGGARSSQRGRARERC